MEEIKLKFKSVRFKLFFTMCVVILVIILSLVLINSIVLENFYNTDNSILTTKDIDFGYATTIHKAQGSTYNNVAVIYNNIKVCRVEKDRKRLAYVALSRCKYLNLIYG